MLQVYFCSSFVATMYSVYFQWELTLFHFISARIMLIWIYTLAFMWAFLSFFFSGCLVSVCYFYPLSNRYEDFLFDKSEKAKRFFFWLGIFIQEKLFLAQNNFNLFMSIIHHNLYVVALILSLIAAMLFSWILGNDGGVIPRAFALPQKSSKGPVNKQCPFHFFKIAAAKFWAC